MMTLARTLALVVLVQTVHAQQPQAQVPALKGPAIAELEAASGSSAVAAAQADGSQVKASGNGTVVVDTRTETYVRNVPAQRECDFDGGADMGGRMRPYRHCINHPGYRERVVADVETVKVADRKAFTGSRVKTGALIGGAIGLLGFFALFAGPIGLLVGLATVAVGAAIGAGIGYATAKNTPDTFTRTNERSSTPL